MMLRSAAWQNDAKKGTRDSNRKRSILIFNIVALPPASRAAIAKNP